MTRNGTPPWPDTDNVEHEGCPHPDMADYAVMVDMGHTVTVLCHDCDRTITVHGTRIIPDGVILESLRWSAA